MDYHNWNIMVVTCPQGPSGLSQGLRTPLTFSGGKKQEYQASSDPQFL